ncbi:MAG TPA: Hint domain-containing protein, partial [Polyangiaceae bacterium]|nr:Hint domain-containing protein [Polyangiaceae bacterium]
MPTQREVVAKRSVCTLYASERGATMLQYITVLGLVTLTGAVAFAAFDDSIRNAVQAETKVVAEQSGEADGPVGSLAEEVAVAGAEALAVQGSWALAQKAGTKGLASARKKQRGRSSTQVSGGSTDRGAPSSGTCRNGVCSQDDGQSCFAAGTPVTTPTGSTPIERIEPGDLVLSRDDLTGNFSIQRVSATFVSLDRELMDVHTVSMNGEMASVRVTPGHQFWTPIDTWVPAAELVYGDALADASGAEVGVVSVEAVRERATVYNLEVEGTHTYFAGTTSVWVHNGCGSSREKSQNQQGQNQQGQNQQGQNQQGQNQQGQNQQGQNQQGQNQQGQNQQGQN